MTVIGYVRVSTEKQPAGKERRDKMNNETKETERSRKRKAKDRDGLYKRRGYWHYEYKDPQTGQWRSKTTGETNYAEAKTLKAKFLESLKGRYNPRNDRLKFTDAADAYIEHRLVAASAGTVRLEKERLRALNRLLAQIATADLKLKDFDIKLVRSYQQRRIAEGVGPRTVNMEGQVLRSILKHHEQWKLDGKYEPLPEPVSEVGRSLTPRKRSSCSIPRNRTRTGLWRVTGPSWRTKPGCAASRCGIYS
jgi:hypothetical protein